MTTPEPELTTPSTEEVDDLFDRRDDDPAARDALVVVYRPLAESLARRYRGHGEPLEDLVQVALLGLLNAVDRFDPAKGFPFQAFAVPTILGELKRHFRDRVWTVRVPRSLQENALTVRDVASALSQELGRPPSIDELAERTGLSADEVLEATDALGALAATSLDAPMGDDEESGLVARLASDDRSLEVAEGWAAIAPHLKKLSERERRIIALRFFEGLSQSRIAEELGISQMHVSRLLARTLEHLRTAMGEDPQV
jgi:RNA polymerase sigma-B factor